MPARAIQQLLPCLWCQSAASTHAVEEIAQTYLDARHQRPPPKQDGRLMRFLPKDCCRQPPAKVDPDATVA